MEKYNKIPERWQSSRGSGICVAVIDTGYSNHIDLTKNVIQKCSVIPMENGFDNYNGHGNMCMGIIAANQKYDYGVTGIAPEAKIVSIKAAEKDGAVSYDILTQAIYLSASLGADIVSISIGGKQYNTGLELAVQFCYDRNIPIVASAGNDGHHLDKNLISYPGRFKDTICVGSIDDNKEISWFSTAGPEIDFVAVGERVRSTHLNDSYKIDSGTSYSAPYIAGIIALLLSKHRAQEKVTGENDCKTVDEIKEHLRKHTMDLGDIGKDNKYGNGVIKIDTLINNGIKPKSLIARLVGYIKSFFG